MSRHRVDLNGSHATAAAVRELAQRFVITTVVPQRPA
jgi:hypothetical protein